MTKPIEDYALIGDLGSAALVARDGTIDWLCLPRFDSDALFAALLGDATNGSWELGPRDGAERMTRRYLDDTLVLETTHVTATGTMRTLDFMHAERVPGPHIVRIVEGIAGTVPVTMIVRARFGFGDLPPWTRRIGDAYTLTAVGDALALRSDVELSIDGHDPGAAFTLRAGDRHAFVLAWYPSHQDVPPPLDPTAALDATSAWWRAWAAQIDYDGAYPDVVRRSLFMLKALTYAPSGASVAAITTSLPEALGGGKNWDYRYAWVRDSTYTIAAFMNGGLVDEARAWRDWLLCALAGRPQNLQIMYGVTGARRIEEFELPDLRGYAGSRPVRVGNAAYRQFQLGVYGETMGAIAVAARHGVEIDATAWAMLAEMLTHVEAVWERPDSGIWESRAAPQHYTHSKVQAWNAFASAVHVIDAYGFRGPRERWQSLAERIHADVCAHAFDPARNTFVQAYGSQALDAALLIIPAVDFLPAGDPRVAGTIAALESHLLRDGFLYRTTDDPETAAADPEPEGAFLACNFWLADAYVMQGRDADARALFERLIGVANDVGMLAEEYDAVRGRQAGNVPQTFSHASLINTARRFAHSPVRDAGSGR